MATRRISRTGLSVLALSGAVALVGSLLPSPATADPRPTIAEVEHRVDALNHEAEQAAERYNDARVQLDKVAADLAAVRKRLAAQQQRVDAAAEELSAFAAATYRAGGVDPTMQLVLAKDPESFLRRASSLSQVSRQQADAYTTVLAARQELAQDQRAVREQLDKEQKVKADLEAQKRQVEAKLAEAKQLLDSLQAEERARIEAAREAARRKALAEARAEAERARRAAAAARAAERSSRSSHRSSAPASSSSSGGSGSSGSSGGGAAPSSGSGRASQAVQFAYAQLGEPYVWGAAGPGSWDCSGLTMMAWRSAGVSLPHSSRAQASSGRRVSRSDLRPGDLVFFYSPISHVGIYIGGGRMIDAPHPGASVRITTVSSMPFTTAVRL